MTKAALLATCSQATLHSSRVEGTHQEFKGKSFWCQNEVKMIHVMVMESLVPNYIKMEGLVTVWHQNDTCWLFTRMTSNLLDVKLTSYCHQNDTRITLNDNTSYWCHFDVKMLILKFNDAIFTRKTEKPIINENKSRWQ